MTWEHLEVVLVVAAILFAWTFAVVQLVLLERDIRATRAPAEPSRVDPRSHDSEAG